MLGFDRVSHRFFAFLVSERPEYSSGMEFSSAEQLIESIEKFRKFGILLYGNVKFAFKLLSSNDQELIEQWENLKPLPAEIFLRRHKPVLPIKRLEPSDAYLTGYLVEKQISESENSGEDVSDLRKKREAAIQIAQQNQNAYLASDHMDVYVATSMREKHEFREISDFTSKVFGSPQLKDLNLRWFDPTQAWVKSRVDKGLAEALMLKRAECTVYLAQVSDTLGKDSELASTLAQGKTVVAYVPLVTENWFRNHLKILKESSEKDSWKKVLIKQIQTFKPAAAWDDEQLRDWLSDETSVDAEELEERLHTAIASHYDKRAELLKADHPLGIQVNLESGVANGVLVVRDEKTCAELIRKIVLRQLEFRLDQLDENFVALRETISNCIFRVVTNDRLLTNIFWNFYTNPAE